MLQRFFQFCTCTVIVAMSVAVLLAQDTATISGTVSDPSGGFVQGVEVTVTQTDTGVSRTATTDAAGSFILSNLPLGPYRLQAMKTGFEVFVQTGIVLQVGSSPTIPVTLKVGDVSERIQVEATTSEVETRNLGVGNVVETQRILDLPLERTTADGSHHAQRPGCPDGFVSHLHHGHRCQHQRGRRHQL